MLLRASKYFSVLTGTLKRYMKDTSRSTEELVNVHVGRRTVFYLVSMRINLWSTA